MFESYTGPAAGHGRRRVRTPSAAARYKAVLEQRTYPWQLGQTRPRPWEARGRPRTVACPRFARRGEPSV